MGKSVTKIQDKDTGRKVSIVESKAVPGKYGIVLLNPDGSQIQAGGNVVGPGSATDGNVVLFDGATGTKIKDSGKTLGEGVLTIQQNNNTVGTFSANANSNNTINVTDTTYNEVTTADMSTGTATTPGVVSAKGIADYVKGKVSNAYVYKGTVSTYEDLPSTGLTAGDVYNVENAHTTSPEFPAGANLAWTGTEWDVLGGLVDPSQFGDMKYSDFNFDTLTGVSVNLDLSSTISPSANFTINAPATIKDGQVYVLRVTNGATAYTMTLGTNIINPHSVDLTLTANAIDMFVFLGVGGKLELQPEDKNTEYTAGTGISISGGVVSNTGVTSVNGNTGSVTLTIPTVNNNTVTIQKNGTAVDSFTLNQNSNKTINITVPTTTNDLTNNSGFVKASDFETATVVGATLTISYFTTQITPSADFTLVAGTVKEGMQYVVRVNSDATAYTMSLGTGVTNPFNEDLTLTASKKTTIILLATSSSTLEIFGIRTEE